MFFLVTTAQQQQTTSSSKPTARTTSTVFECVRALACYVRSLRVKRCIRTSHAVTGFPRTVAFILPLLDLNAHFQHYYYRTNGHKKHYEEGPNDLLDGIHKNCRTPTTWAATPNELSPRHAPPTLYPTCSKL